MTTEELMVKGRIAFLPWTSIGQKISLLGFAFQPITLEEISAFTGPEIAEEAAAAIRTHVDQAGKPVEGCTLVLRPRSAVPWDIPDNSWRRLAWAAELLAFGALAEQRFLVNPVFSPHMNAAMFRPVNHAVTAGSPFFSVFYPRRGGGLRVGGRSATNTVFQQPYQVEGTKCGRINNRLIRAILQAERMSPAIFNAVQSALDLWLLANSESPELDIASCNMLSAMSFERLMEPSETSASKLAETFSSLWARFPVRTIGSSPKIKMDNEPTWHAEQQSWPLRRKWIKELYEARSAYVHRGTRSRFSTNWDDWQHLVIAAYVFPLAVKLRLEQVGLYHLDDDEVVSCGVLDDLLCSDWGDGTWQNTPEWPRILDEAQASSGRYRAITQAMQDAGLLP
ncbi:hypothetical protein [Rhizobium leguminosarum]|uniref:hypothetical protein n=1 Tax=Rhizobium leguminosarum TaxID=384 RepID=UPI001C9845F6|nr:hypothetical protein [Rhizobium leguminosarum]MBY5660916.1 hypothetical protein [Rhizobium leguminosarum]MBY5674952.1 hypothetical protein [Rhizobium leguminosarum]